MNRLIWLYRRSGRNILVPVLFGVSLFHFLAADAQRFFLTDICSAILIVVLFIIQSIFLKLFLEISDLRDPGSSWRNLVTRFGFLQPLVLSIIFLLVQLLTIRLRGFERLVSLVEDPQSFAYYSLALEISDPATYVHEWLALMQVPLLYWGGHLATHFPGYPLLIYLGFQLFGRNPESVILLVTSLSALVTFPLFYLARQAYGPRAAVFSCVLYSWIPSISLGIPYMDLTVAIFTLTSLLLFLKSLETDGKNSHSLLGGLVLSLAVLLTFVSAALLVLVLIVAARTDGGRRATFRLLHFLCGFLLPYVILELFFGMPFLEAASWAFRTNQWFYQHLHSLSPSVWSMQNSALLFLVLLGLPVFLIFLIAVFRMVKSILLEPRGDAFALGLSLMLLVTVVVARLELARVAVFVTPIIAVCVAAEITQKPTRLLWVNSLLLSAALYLETYTYLSQAILLSRFLGYPVE